MVEDHLLGSHCHGATGHLSCVVTSARKAETSQASILWTQWGSLPERFGLAKPSDEMELYQQVLVWLFHLVHHCALSLVGHLCHLWL